MTIDNDIYNRSADAWWDDNGFLQILRTGMNPPRFGYFRELLAERLAIGIAGKRTLDIGCGGGLLSEEFARAGADVTGIDLSAPSIATARAHAAQNGLAIKYCVARGEEIPFPAESFDIVYCCDTLEHVSSLDKVIAETARVLKRGGIYCYDTINRNWLSKLIGIKLLQEWRWTSCVPAHIHDWNMFIKPRELHAAMRRHGLENRELRGISPVSPLRALGAMIARNRGKITAAELGCRLGLTVSDDTSVLYIGYGVKL